MVTTTFFLIFSKTFLDFWKFIISIYFSLQFVRYHFILAILIKSPGITSLAWFFSNFFLCHLSNASKNILRVSNPENAGKCVSTRWLHPVSLRYLVNESPHKTRSPLPSSTHIEIVYYPPQRAFFLSLSIVL